MTKIIIASGPVIVENGKVLLNQHGDTDFWKFCGGRVEDFDLNLIETAKREVKEEMGLDIEIINPEPFFMYTIKETTEGDVDVVLIHFLAKRLNEITPGSDIREWRWVPIASLESEKLAPNILPTLRHFKFIE